MIYIGCRLREIKTTQINNIKDEEKIFPPSSTITCLMKNAEGKAFKISAEYYENKLRIGGMGTVKLIGSVEAVLNDLRESLYGCGSSEDKDKFLSKEDMEAMEAHILSIVE
jgi:hypothetical protein